jgi:hypothetical protein
LRAIFGLTRYFVLIPVVGLLIAAVATFVYAGIATVTTISEIFREGHFNAEGARVFSVDMIEYIDLFLLGTVLLITAIGLYQLFIDPKVREDLPAWLSVTNLEQLKFNLLAVVVVMISILGLSALAGEHPENTSLLDIAASAALLLAGISFVVWVFGRESSVMETNKRLELEAEVAVETEVSRASRAAE